MCRVDGELVGQLIEPAQCSEHLVRERHRERWAAQVGAPDSADHQRTAGEQRDRRAVLDEEVGVVVWCVTGSRPGDEFETIGEGDVFTVADWPMR